MKVDAVVIRDAHALLNANMASVARAEQEIVCVGCSWCANCSGIVGG